MEAILEWIKGIVILFVVLSALLYLVPKAQYKKYIRFFLDMVLVIAVIQPISKIVYASDEFAEKIEYSQFWQEMENMQKDVEKMEFFESDYYREEYESAIEQDICRMAEGKEYEVCQIDAVLSENYELENVSLVIERASPEEWEIEDVEIAPIGDAQSLAEKTILEQGALELEQEIKTFYQLGEEQIVIELKE